MKDLSKVFEGVHYKTRRLAVSPTGLEDLEGLFEIYKNPEHFIYQNGDGYQDKEKMRSQLHFFLQGRADKVFMKLSIFYEEKLIGLLSLHTFDFHNHKLAIGYSLNQEYWRKGFAFEALEGLMGELFKSYSLERLEASIHPDNKASIGLVEKLGFLPEGCKRRAIFNKKRQSFEDRLIYSIIREDFYQISLVEKT